MGMIIQQDETEDWFKEYPCCHSSLLQDYKEAISDMTDQILIDPRSSKNTHIVNNEFVTQPTYFMAF